ncbi:MAG: carbohydrate kinase [Clostridiales bacterium]|jgi:fructokinase|nr:carbohydrate kinase [Clostridiales bacterium]
MFDASAIGELLIDFTPSGVNDQGLPLYSCNPGGAPANVLAMIAILGGNTAFIGKVGKDAFGSFLRKALEDSKIDVSGLAVDASCGTTLAFVHLSPSGDRSFSFYRNPGADLLLETSEVKLDIIDESKIFHFGSVSLTGEPCRTTIFESVAYAKEKGKIISYDPNFRPALWSDEIEAKTVISKPIPSVDLLKVSLEEMELITGISDVKIGSAVLAEMGPSIVLVSLGANGAYFLCSDGCGHLPAYKVDTIDTTGAGDAFLGAVLYRLRNKDKKSIKSLSWRELGDIVDFANAAGSLATTKRGAIPAMPSLNDIKKCRNGALNL